jgi:hypothetical protein
MLNSDYSTPVPTFLLCVDPSDEFACMNGQQIYFWDLESQSALDF